MKYLHLSEMITMKNILKIVSFMALSLIYTNANAFGIGFYTTLTSSGDADWEGTSSSTNLMTTNRDLDQREIGFVLDTAIASDRLFNYRFQFALVDATYGSSDMDGFVLTNTFGFGVVRNSNLRFWIGPQVGFKWLDSKDNTDISVFTFDLGAATGLNYHISSNISLTAEAGYRWGFGVADSNFDETSSTTGDLEYDISENQLFVNVGLLFRFGRDKY